MSPDRAVSMLAIHYNGKVLGHFLDKENTAGNVRGDTAYRSGKNEVYVRVLNI